MRNPDRLDEFYMQLKDLHKSTVPDWRFGQLIVNFMKWYGNDIFFLEEENFLAKFEEFLNHVIIFKIKR